MDPVCEVHKMKNILLLFYPPTHMFSLQDYSKKFNWF
jgi:hypothetical protein